MANVNCDYTINYRMYLLLIRTNRLSLYLIKHNDKGPYPTIDLLWNTYHMLIWYNIISKIKEYMHVGIPCIIPMFFTGIISSM